MLTNLEAVWMTTAIAELKTVVLKFLLYVLSQNTNCIENFEKVVLFHTSELV